MKKVLMTLVAVMAVSVSMVAAPKAEKNAEPTKYTINFNSHSIARYLSMSNDQVADMERVHDNFSREMKKAEYADEALTCVLFLMRLNSASTMLYSMQP